MAYLVFMPFFSMLALGAPLGYLCLWYTGIRSVDDLIAQARWMRGRGLRPELGGN